MACAESLTRAGETDFKEVPGLLPFDFREYLSPKAGFMTSKLETTLKDWLSSEESPAGFYDLLGMPLLSSDTKELADRIDEAVEFLFGYQNNHKETQIRERARKFGKQLAEARRLLRDPEQLKAYDRQLVHRQWEAAWEGFLDQFEEARHDEIRSFCQKDDSREPAETVVAGDETFRGLGDTILLPEVLRFPFEREAARSAQQTWAASLNRPAVWESSVGMKLVMIPPGTFRMGSLAAEKGHFENERQVEVVLSQPFFLGQFPVTQDQWREVMSREPWKDRDFAPPEAEAPATYLSWDEAVQFCRLLTEEDHAKGRLPDDWRYALPTEAQWEFACRSGAESRYYFGDEEAELHEFAWFEENAWDAGDGHPMPVGGKRPNAFGLYDMAGNVWEWCRDWYLPGLPGGTDPEVTEATDLRATRGGSWGQPAVMCRSAYRMGQDPQTQNSSQGFRVAAVPVD